MQRVSLACLVHVVRVARLTPARSPPYSSSTTSRFPLGFSHDRGTWYLQRNASVKNPMRACSPCETGSHTISGRGRRSWTCTGPRGTSRRSCTARSRGSEPCTTSSARRGARSPTPGPCPCCPCPGPPDRSPPAR
jgi:hypothetical protein